MRAVDDAKRAFDALIDDIAPAVEQVSDKATRLLEEVGVRMDRGNQEVFRSEDEAPRVQGERPVPKVFRPNISGRARVVDGDTVEIGQTRVRLHGIDAPESRQSCIADGRRWPCGERATRALAGRIGSQTVSCVERDRDRYGRTVAVCHAAGKDLNAWMVRQGWALAYQQYSKAYIADESDARAGRRGMWRGDFVPPWDWRRGARLAGARAASQEAAGGKCRIKGNIGRGGSRIYHVAGGQYYDRTRINTAKGERWFCTEAEARAAGWRRSKR